jgi:hypothetical protein
MDVSGRFHAPAALPPGGWVGPRAGLDVVVKGEIPCPSWNSNPRSSSPQPSAIPMSYPGSCKHIYAALHRLRFLPRVAPSCKTPHLSTGGLQPAPPIHIITYEYGGSLKVHNQLCERNPISYPVAYIHF